MVSGAISPIRIVSSSSVSSSVSSEIKRQQYHGFADKLHLIQTSYSVSSLRLHGPPRGIVLACLPSPSMANTTSFSSTKLFVSGLSFRTTKESLTNAFQKFGELVEVNLVMDRIANRSRGFAFLRYITDEESKKAIEGMHGKFLDGRVIFVEVAKSKAELRQDLKENPQIQC